MIKDYGKIHSLGHREVKNIFDGDVVIQEKVDGSQISFLASGGKIYIKSKEQFVDLERPNGMFLLAVNSILTLPLREGVTYRGEYLQRPKHNVLKYDRTPQAHIILFDVDKGNQDYLPIEEAKEEAERMGLEFVPTLFTGEIVTPEQLAALLERESVLGGQKIEGVVIKNYSKLGRDDRVLMAKVVSERFKESHKEKWGKGMAGHAGILEKLGEIYRTKARWEKAIQHLREQGKLEDDPRDIGPLIKEIQRDVVEEEKEQIKQMLWEYFAKDIRGVVVRGFPEFYKQSLTEKQFSKEKEDETVHSNEREGRVGSENNPNAGGGTQD